MIASILCGRQPNKKNILVCVTPASSIISTVLIRNEIYIRMAIKNRLRQVFFFANGWYMLCNFGLSQRKDDHRRRNVEVFLKRWSRGRFLSLAERNRTFQDMVGGKKTAAEIRVGANKCCLQRVKAESIPSQLCSSNHSMSGLDLS